MTSYELSPPKKEPQRIVNQDPTIPKYYLVLGAFSSVPKLHYEELPLGRSKKKILVIRNPGDKACFLKICKLPPSTFAVTVENSLQHKDEDIFVPAAAEVHAEITWTPKEQGQFFETLQLMPSTGGTKISVHLLGKCTPPPKNAGSRKRQVAPSVPAKSTSSALSKVAASLNAEPKFASQRVTLPHSPNFSTRFSSRSASSSTCNTPATKQEAPGNASGSLSDVGLSVLASRKIAALSLPFTPEADRTTAESHIPSAEIPNELTEFGLMLPPHIDEEHLGLGKPNSHHKILMDQEAANADVSSPSRRETYSLPTASVPLALSPADDGEIGSMTFSSNGNTEVPLLESASVEENAKASELDISSASGIELDSTLLENIAQALDNDLDQVHRSVDTILGQMGSKIGATQKAAITALTNLANLDEDAIMKSISIDDEEDSHLREKTNSGEFLCIDPKELAPSFPSDDVKVDTELVSAMKQLLKDGKAEADIIKQYSEGENSVSEEEIRALFQEIGNKYKSCRECFDVLKVCHLSENYTFNRIAIQKAIKSGKIKLRQDLNIFENSCKIQLISNMITEYCRPWLWSALCLVFHDDKLEADDIDIMTFIDEFLFCNNEFEDLTDSPSRMEEETRSEFLQHYLEIVYLLDESGIPSVFATSSSSKNLLENFESKYLENGNLQELLTTCPLKLTHNIDPFYFLMQQNLQGKDLFAWTNIVALMQELSDRTICMVEEERNTSVSNMEKAEALVKLALSEAKKLGIECQIPEEDVSWVVHGVVNLDNKFLRDAVIRIRLNQCKKMKSAEE